MQFALKNLELPVRIRLERPMTDEELMRFCAENELLRVERDANGELIVMTPTGSQGSGRNSEIITDLVIWARKDGRGKVFDSNGGFTMPDGSMRAADAAWVSWRRWNALTHEQQEGFAPLCPEFVIELRSASDRLPELQAKMQMWLANGAEVAWLIDPSRKTVEVYRAGRVVVVLVGGCAVVGDGVMAGFELELARIWA